MEPKAGTNEKPYTSYATIKAKEVDWLWEPYIPYGKLTILQGDPGEGKSTLAIQIASVLTRGEPFPEGSGRRFPENVIYQCAEDDPEDTVLTRLKSAGADLDRVFFINEENGNLTFEDREIEESIRLSGARLVIIDPIQAFIPPDGDMQSASYMRGLMRRLASIAQKYGCAVILIGHMNKARNGKSLYRGLGSIDIPAIARSVLMVMRNDKVPGIRYMCQIKSNLAPEGDAVAFYLNENGIFHWIGPCCPSFNGMEQAAVNGRKKQDMVKECLRTILSLGGVPTKEVLSKVRLIGISEKTARNAGKEMNIKSYRKGGRWHWRLPDEAEEETDR